MKIKIILFAVIAGMGLLAWFLMSQIHNLKKDRDTQIENVHNLLSENSHYKALNLTLSQTDSIYGLKLDSLAKALKIKPKTIIRTVEVTQVVSDTSNQATEVTPGENQGEVKIWEIHDFAGLKDKFMKLFSHLQIFSQKKPESHLKRPPGKLLT